MWTKSQYPTFLPSVTPMLNYICHAWSDPSLPQASNHKAEKKDLQILKPQRGGNFGNHNRLKIPLAKPHIFIPNSTILILSVHLYALWHDRNPAVRFS